MLKASIFICENFFFRPRSASFNVINASCEGVLSCSVLESKQKSCVHVSFGCIMMTAVPFPFPVFEYFEGVGNLFPPPKREGKALL